MTGGDWLYNINKGIAYARFSAGEKIDGHMHMQV
jgi:hypothetical protein